MEEFGKIKTVGSSVVYQSSLYALVKEEDRGLSLAKLNLDSKNIY